MQQGAQDAKKLKVDLKGQKVGIRDSVMGKTARF
jgi:hypothetical protein